MGPQSSINAGPALRVQHGPQAQYRSAAGGIHGMPYQAIHPAERESGALGKSAAVSSLKLLQNA